MEIVVPRQFRGPPTTANGGYICGLLAHRMGGRGRVMLRAGVPVDAAARLEARDGGFDLLSAEGALLAHVDADEAPFETPPPSPGVDAARRAAAASPFAQTSLHRGCFSCCIERAQGEGLGVHVGQIEGAAPGVAAGLWVPHANFADASGAMPDEITWGALDCPGSMSWQLKLGVRVGLLGTMRGQVLRAPRAGETCVVVSWAGEAEGRKHHAGVALYDAEGALIAQAAQIWISFTPR